jgi:hypothetical protein
MYVQQACIFWHEELADLKGSEFRLVVRNPPPGDALAVGFVF